MLATVSDKRVVTSTASLADIHSLQDYYPFGIVMKGRSATLQVNGGTTELAFQIDVDANPGNYQGLDRYRFGFQGQESDDEWIEGKLALRETAGRVLLRHKQNWQAGQNAAALELSGIAPGVYILEIRAGAVVQHAKVLIE